MKDPGLRGDGSEEARTVTTAPRYYENVAGCGVNVWLGVVTAPRYYENVAGCEVNVWLGVG